MLRAGVKTYCLPDVDKTEALRYGGMRGENEDVTELFLLCEKELGKVSGKIVFARVSVSVNGAEVEFPFGKVSSVSLAKNLDGCSECVIFVATVGAEVDRNVIKYSTLSPVKALAFQAIGAERIERTCELFCAELKENGEKTRPRFSPGYGDFPLAFQREIFAFLSPQKYIGVVLTSSLLMTPTKSVSAIVGIDQNAEKNQTGCVFCDKGDCNFRE